MSAAFLLSLAALWIGVNVQGARFKDFLHLDHEQVPRDSEIDRCDFPRDFAFGVSSSAYQYEGAVQDGGRKPSIWDKFSHFPGNIADGANGDLGNDQFHKFKEDIALISSLGMKAYRFSISWSRFFPDGVVNPQGLAYYNDLIDQLKAAEIEPYVTLYHFDLPLALEEANGGWLNKTIVDSFAAYSEACFRAFGDRVRHWITFNEPQLISLMAYSQGVHAPGRCSACSKGNSLTEPYIVGHNMLLSHAAAVRIYRQKYQTHQGGKIGITLNSYWFEPLSDSKQDVEASERSLDFELGWFLSPLMLGDYPESMRNLVKNRLPEFTDEQKQALKNSIDFLGLNHYTARYVGDLPGVNRVTTANDDPGVLQLVERNGIQIGPRSASSWMYVVPWGIEKLLLYIQTRYNPPEIVITENGIDEPNDASLSLEQSLQDNSRIKFYKDYLKHVSLAMRKGAKVSGYFAWTLLDNYEWRFGYSFRFGLHFVDFKTMQRFPKNSALWFRQFLQTSSCEQLASSL